MDAAMRNGTEHTPVFDMVLFGGTGDLVMRKLLPSMYQAHAAGLLHDDGRILALGRKDFSRDEYLAYIGEHESSSTTIATPGSMAGFRGPDGQRCTR